MSFKSFDFSAQIEKGIATCGYTSPTPIQSEAIPPILKGRDVIGLAQTGTGKTAAFVLPMLQHLSGKACRDPRGLIVAPTRELAEQIHENIRSLAAHTRLKSLAVYGGIGKHHQIDSLRRGVDILVACPGRLLDLLNDGALTLASVRFLVLDEADQMLDMGFFPDIKRIIAKLPAARQSLVFSATMPKEIDALTRQILTDPVRVRVNHTQPVAAISHTRFDVAKQERTLLLKQLLGDQEIAAALVFTRTKYKAKGLAAHLKKSGFKATSLQGNLSQAQRKRAMEGFRTGEYNIMVATDIAARGIDVSDISHVINYDLPDTVETYIHRTGRTGRAERSGRAYAFVCPEDVKMLSLIEKQLGQKMDAATGAVFTPDTEPIQKTGSTRNADRPKNLNKTRNTARVQGNTPSSRGEESQSRQVPRKKKRPARPRSGGGNTAFTWARSMAVS